MAANHLLLRNAEVARDNLLSKQKKEIEQLYNKWADDIGKKAEYYKMKTTSSSVVSEMQLRSLEKQLRASSQVLSNEINSKIKSNMRIMADSVVSSNKDWLRSLGFSEKGLDIAFSHVPTEAIQSLVSGQVYRSGWSLSSRIWGNNEETLKDIYTVVAKGRAENLSVYEIAKELQTYVKPSAQLPWNLRMKDGQKIYHRQVDYNAQRLARTLVQHTYQQSFALAAKENPFITHVIWNSNGSRACELCLERDGKKFKIEDMPLDHPNGMCTMVPDVDEKMIDKLADWVKGEDGDFPEIDEFAKKFGYEPVAKKVDMNSLKNNLEDYVGGGYLSPKDALTKEEYEYILENMIPTKSPMYRLEESRYTFEKKELEVGDAFSFDDNLRSFSRSKEYIDETLEMGDVYDTPVIFETVGEAKHFNMDKYATNYYENQSESLVGGKFEVVGFDMRRVGDLFYQVVKIKQRL